MYGFLEVEEFIFTNDDQLVVDPSSEKLKTNLIRLKSYIPIGAIQRIDEVIESGEAGVRKRPARVSPFPLNIQPTKKLTKVLLFKRSFL